MLPRSSPERSILYGRLNREAETLRFSTGITRAGKTNDCPRTASTSHAGHCAGRMMPDVARERVTNPPAGTALAPSQGVSSRRTSLRKARWASFSSAGGVDSRNSAGARHLFDPTRLFFRRLFDSQRSNCDYAAMIRLFCANSRTYLCFRSFDSRNMTRHPEVAAKRPSKDAAEAPEPPPFEVRSARTSG